MTDRPQIRGATAAAQNGDECDDAHEDQTDDNNPIHSEDSTVPMLMLSRE